MPSGGAVAVLRRPLGHRAGLGLRVRAGLRRRRHHLDTACPRRTPPPSTTRARSQAVTSQLPGFTGDSGTWQSETADLSAYAGKDVLVGFRYLTDPGVNEAGFWVRDLRSAAPRCRPRWTAGRRSRRRTRPRSPGTPCSSSGYDGHGRAAHHTVRLDRHFRGLLGGACCAQPRHAGDHDRRDRDAGRPDRDVDPVRPLHPEGSTGSLSPAAERRASAPSHAWPRRDSPPGRLGRPCRRRGPAAGRSTTSRRQDPPEADHGEHQRHPAVADAEVRPHARLGELARSTAGCPGPRRARRRARSRPSRARSGGGWWPAPRWRRCRPAAANTESE